MLGKRSKPRKRSNRPSRFVCLSGGQKPPSSTAHPPRRSPLGPVLSLRSQPRNERSRNRLLSGQDPPRRHLLPSWPKPSRLPPSPRPSHTPERPSRQKNGQRHRLPAKKKLPAKPRLWSVQVQATTRENAARQTVLRLRRQGYSPSISRVVRQETVWYRVRVGPFSKELEAKAAVSRFRRQKTFAQAYPVSH